MKTGTIVRFLDAEWVVMGHSADFYPCLYSHDSENYNLRRLSDNIVAIGASPRYMERVGQ